MSIAILVACYLFCGMSFWFGRTMKIGKHRAEHGGKMGNSCTHWACDLMTDDPFVSALFIVLWPVAQPVHWINRLTRWVIKIQYERSLPPANEGPGRVVYKSYEGPKY